MKCNQKTIGQGTVLKSPHPCPGIRAGIGCAVERSCPLLPRRSRRCVGTVTDLERSSDSLCLGPHPDQENHGTADTNA